MATHRISILGSFTNPDTSGDVFPDQLGNYFTNDLYKGLAFVFADTSTKIGLIIGFNVPKNYSASTTDPKIIVVWTSSTSANNVVWDCDYRAFGGNDTESLDASTHQESVTVTDAAPSASWERLEASMALTRANIAADDTIHAILSRDGANASDTHAAAAVVVDVIFEYSDA